MKQTLIACFGFVTVLAAAAALGQTVPLDVRDVRPGPAAVTAVEDGVAVEWEDEADREWRATFSLDPDLPLIESIAVDGAAVVSAVRPFYQVETGTRRRGWNAFFDFPPSHPDGTRHAQGVFRLRSATARSIGERVELTFDGLRMGVFEGAIAYTIYPGSRLIQQEAVAATDAADVAYYYDGGWEMAAAADRTPGGNMQTRVSWYDTAGALRHDVSTGFDPERKPVQVRYRTLAATTAAGSVAVFPAPHQYFFPRDFTSNLGHVWHRSWRGRVSLGIRQIRDTNWRFYPWMNAPPGETQRMSVFFVLSDGAAEAALDDVLAFTNRDRFRPLDGYKTLSTHWHLAYTMQALEHGFDWTPPFKPVLKAMGVDASIIMDFHGDGHPRDLTDLRLDELDAYFGALRAQSEPDFLLIPSEEANVHFGGHWALVFPRPVYWFMDRPEGGAFETTHPRYGTVYSTADAAELLELVRREGGVMYQTHPRTKGSTGYPGPHRGDRALPRPRLSRRGVEGDARRPLVPAARRAVAEPARRPERPGAEEAHLRRGRRVPVRRHPRAVRAHEHQLRAPRRAAAVRPLGRGGRAAGAGRLLHHHRRGAAARGGLLGLDRGPPRRLDGGGLDVPLALRGDRVGRRSRRHAPRGHPVVADAGSSAPEGSRSPPTPPAGRGRGSRSGTWPATARSSIRRGGSEPGCDARAGRMRRHDARRPQAAPRGAARRGRQGLREMLCCSRVSWF